MELFRNVVNLSAPHLDCVATIGNFDGFHLGHQKILKQLHARSDELGLPIAVIVFEPQPLEFFDPENAPPRLTRWREKYELLKEHGVDHMVCIRFNADVAALEPNNFVIDILLKKVGVKHLVIGDDFQFGQARKGDYRLLKLLGDKHGFEVERAATYMVNDVRASSSAIRQALTKGDLDLAASFLGRKYSISGRVAHGDKQGRQLGFPTANIKLRRMKTALKGILVTQVLGLSEKPLPAVSYIGSKPTLGGTRTVLETHLFDHSDDIYGKSIKVEFLKKLRDDTKFESFEVLRQEIARDTQMAREYFLALDQDN